MKMIKNTVTIKGVMAIKDGKAWGEDPNSDSGHRCWVDIAHGLIADPKFAASPEDLTYEGDRRKNDLAQAKLVNVTRTEITVLEFDDEQ